jgi:hypothetical protein
MPTVLIWYLNDDDEIFRWFPDGSWHRRGPRQLDIVKVGAAIDFMYPHVADPSMLKDALPGVIPTGVLKAAMDAGIKANPAYEDFVRAILVAGMGEARKHETPAPIERLEQIGTEPYDSWNFSRDLCDKLKVFKACHPAMSTGAIASAFMRFFRENGWSEPQNESENRNRVSAELKGGLSDLTDADINEITYTTFGDWPSFEAQSWACKVVHAVVSHFRAGLCEDEGCPHHGRPHVCLNLNDEQLKKLDDVLDFE